MLFLIRKLVESLLLPVGLCGWLVVWGVLARRRGLAFLGVAILWVSAMPIVGDSLADPLQRSYPELTFEQCPHADAVVVLGGYIVRGGSPFGVQWGSESGRFLTAVNLKLAGKARFLVLTGSNSSSGNSQVDVLRSEAVKLGVPAGDILVVGPVGTTADEAGAVAALPSIRTAIVVSNAFHLPRAMMLFRAYGIDMIPFATDPRDLLNPTHGVIDFVPIGSGVGNTETALREYYGLAVYKILLALRPPPERIFR